MLTILHGDNTEASRSELYRMKGESGRSEAETIDGKNLDQTRLIECLQTASLFGENRLVVIERLFSKLTAKSKNISDYIDLIITSQYDVILWEEKSLTPAQLKLFPRSAVIKEFLTPKVIFQFLDALKPGNTKAVILYYQQALDNIAPELIFAMIVKRLRQLMMLKDRVVPTGLAPWQANRLTSQANFFTMEKLTAMHLALLQIDYLTKTGNSPLDIRDQLTVFIASI